MRLSRELFAIFSQFVERACGMHYGESERDLFGAKLVSHAEECGHVALLDYYYRLRFDDPEGVERARLLDALLVHETYFFRELLPLVQLVATCIEPAVMANGVARVWSAACATGEEPYTLAMLLAERGLLDRVEIVATDISAAIVARARLGRSRRRSLRAGHPPALAGRYLEIQASDIVVAPEIRDAVEFSTLNLVDDADHPELGLFDAILCRNVLIYFTDQQIARVLDRLGRQLAPNGLIAVGISESLLRFGTTLVCEERGNAFFYRMAS